MDHEKPLERAIQLLGGVVAMARVLHIDKYQVIQQWLKTQVPFEWCPLIEEATAGAVTCYELRPDLSKQLDIIREAEKKAA